MAKTSTRTTVFDATPDELLDVILSKEFQEEQRKIDEAVVSATYTEKERTPDRVVFELRSTEYERGMTGINKKKTVETVTSVTWDLRRRQSQWTYTNPSVDKFSLKGSQRIEDAGGGKSKFIAEFTVEVKIPLVGKKAESLIAKGMEEGSEKYDDLLRSYLARKK